MKESQGHYEEVIEEYYVYDENPEGADRSNEAEAEAAGSGLVLPFDPSLLFRGLIRKLWFVFFITILSFVSSYWLVKKKLPGSYKSKAVLLRPASRMVRESLSVLALSEIISLPDVLRILRHDMDIDSKLRDIKRKLEIDVQPRTGVMKLTFESSTGSRAAAVLGRLIEIFLETTSTFKARETAKLSDYCQSKLANVRREMRTVEKQFQKYKEDNEIVHLDTEIVQILEQYNKLDASGKKIEGEAYAVKIQLENIDSVFSEISHGMQKENQQTAHADSVTNLKQKSLRLQEIIKDVRQRNAWERQMAQLNKQLDRYKKLEAPGYVTGESVENIELRKDLLANKMEDSSEIIDMRRQIAEIDKLLVPTSGNNSVNLLLKDTMIRRFKLKLDHASLSKKADQMRQACSLLKLKIAELPQKEAEYSEFKRRISGLESYERSLVTKVDDLKSLLKNEAQAFQILEPPSIPARPTQSKAKLIVIALTGMGLFMSSTLILGLELRHYQIRVGREINARLGVDLMGIFYKDVGDDFERERETLRKATHKLSKSGQKVLLVTSVETSGGATTAVCSLAEQLVRSAKKILVIETDLRSNSRNVIAKRFEKIATKVGTIDKIINGSLTVESLQGSKNAKEASNIDPKMSLGTIDYIIPGRMTENDLPKLAGKSFQDFVTQAKEIYDFVIIDSSALSPWPDVSLLKWCAESILLVVESGRFSPWSITNLISKSGIEISQIGGAFLTGADPLLES